MSEQTQEAPIMEVATQPERWGGFDLSLDAKTASEAGGTPGPRHDFPLTDSHSPWSSPLTTRLTTEAVARGDARVPYPEWIPTGESLVEAAVLEDENGAASAMVGFLIRDHPEVSQYARPGGGTTGDDADVKISWNAMLGRPAYMLVHEQPAAVDSTSVDTATVLEDPLIKVRVKGHEGIMRVWKPAPGAASMYGRRLPTVTINWYEGPIFWSVQSTFLSPEDALRLAESIRPTVTE